MHEVVQPVYVDKHQADQGRQKAPESANAPIFPSKSFNSSCIISLIIVLKRAYGRQLSLQGVAIDAKRRPLPANCSEKAIKQKLRTFSERSAFCHRRSAIYLLHVAVFAASHYPETSQLPPRPMQI